MKSSQYIYRQKPIAQYLLLSELLFIALFLLMYFWVIPSVPNLVFERPEWAYGLLASLVLAPVFWWALGRKSRDFERFASINLGSKLAPRLSPMRHLLRFILWRWGAAMLIIAIMNPRMGLKEIEVESSGADIMILLDVSNSMLASDMAPDRLSTAKRSVFKLLDELAGDRIGLIPFAGDAFIQLPLTSDYSAVGLFLSSIETDIIPMQGTAIGKAIDLAVDRLAKYSDGSAAIIILTDGENHEDDAVEAAKRAIAEGIRVHTVGLGSTEGAPIPAYENGQTRGFKKDKEGNTIISKYDPAMLQNIAQAGDGLFLSPVDGYVDLKQLHDAILGLEQSENQTEKFETYHDRFQLFLLLAAFCFILESILPLAARIVSKPKNLSTDT